MNTRKEILDLLAKGKITADEAASMLTSAGKAEKAPPAPEPEPVEEPVRAHIPVEEEVDIEMLKKAERSGNGPRWLRVRVRNMKTGKNKVSVNLPFGMFKFGFNMARNFTSSLDNIDLDEMAATLKQNDDGMLVEVQDEESNEQVQIFLS
ncbi:MAG: hypothetical protein AAF614_16900 [Chloroflexota bacterium]